VSTEPAGEPLVMPPGEAVVLCPTCLHDGVLERTLARAEAAEAKLAAIEAHSDTISRSLNYVYLHAELSAGAADQLQAAMEAVGGEAREGSEEEARDG
jgi:hypothetical protein